LPDEKIRALIPAGPQRSLNWFNTSVK